MSAADEKAKIYIELRKHSALVEINEPLIRSVTKTIHKVFEELHESRMNGISIYNDNYDNC